MSLNGDLKIFCCNSLPVITTYCILPATFKGDDALVWPALLFALHVYSPLSSTKESRIIRVPLESSRTRSPTKIPSPSLVQLTSGLGTPCTAHVILIVAPLNALIVDPTSAVTLLCSSKVTDPFGGWILGSKGSKTLKMFGLLLFFFDGLKLWKWNIWNSYIWTADKKMNKREIIAVIYAT